MVIEVINQRPVQGATYTQAGNAHGDGVDDNVPSRAKGGHEEGQEDEQHQPDDKPQRILHNEMIGICRKSRVFFVIISKKGIVWKVNRELLP